MSKYELNDKTTNLKRSIKFIKILYNNISLFYLNGLIILFIIGISNIFFAQTNETKFEHISIEQGLSQSSVFSICQDNQGFLWFGTLDGLDKYDGYKFIVYKSDPQDSTTLGDNTVFKIYEDREGMLWVGTLGGGLNKFDKATEKFTRYTFDSKDTNSISNNNIRAIFEDSEGNLWVGTNNGLNKLNRKSGKFTRYLHNPKNPNSISNNYVWTIYESPSKPGILWIGTYDGLNKYNIHTGRFTVYKNRPNDSFSLSNNYVWSIIQGYSGYLWVGTNYGLDKFNPTTGKFVRYIHDPSNPNSISFNNVWSLCKDNKGEILVGTLGGGLNKIVWQRKNNNEHIKFTHYLHNSENPFSLSQNYVWSIYEDRTGVLWIGTDIGLNKLDPEKEKFIHYSSTPYNPHSLSNNEVTAIYKDHLGILWIGTRNGLNKFNPTTKKFVHFKSNTKNPFSISNNYIRSIYEDKEGYLWIGTNGGGLNKYIRDKNIFIHYEFGNSPKGLSNSNVTSILEDQNGNLWLGTLAGLDRLNPKTGNIEVFIHKPGNLNSLSHDYVYTIYMDKTHKFWIGTLGGGLDRFDPRTGKFFHYTENPKDTTSLSNNNVWCIYQDSRGTLWIGTNNGLDKFNQSKGTFTHYSEQNGLINNVIYGILEDKHGNLWLSSNKGLSKFNPVSGKIRNYSTSDGLQSDQFNGNAYFEDSKGEMYFGGINGFNMFYPDSIKDNPYKPPIVITDFQIFNQSVKIGKDSPLHKSISETKTIILPYSDNVFSFEFAALHYSSPESNQYAYKMEGFDRNWVYSGTRRYVTYTNLDPGKYVFKVIGSNNDGVWNKQGVSINIIIDPPFWRTWWFLSLFTIFILSIIGSIIYIRINNLLAIERLRLKIAEDLHDDIGTKLTEISLLSDMVYHVNPDDPKSLKDSVRNIGGIARSLIENMSDIVWLINPKRDSLYELFLKLKDNYEELLSFNKIDLYINNLNFLEKIRLPMEYRKNVYLIFKEAMNNSIKYSECSEISLNTEVNRNLLIITMYDNGKGFNIDRKYSGNGLENMKNRADSISGNLRIQSKKGEGTMIKFTGRIIK